LQELKALGHERTAINAGARVLDVGCGFGLETLRLARLAAPGGLVAGCDLSSDFLAEARHRASAARVDITFEQARVEALPYPNQSFGVAWSERLLIYVPDESCVAFLLRPICPSRPPEVKWQKCAGGHYPGISNKKDTEVNESKVLKPSLSPAV
jgi:2-polyprenyl-3-methyl-5-hydroxy-6-metoxy-1,4-benzoquinol methylase